MLVMNDERDLAIAEVHEATSIYTTSPVVADLLRRVGWPCGDTRLVDPSAGDGAFLVGAIEMLAPAPGDFKAVGRIKGYEIFPPAVAQAQRRVLKQLVSHGWSQDDAALAADAMVEECDFLASDTVLGQEFDLICGNPPYLRFARLPEYFKSIYGRSLPKHALGDLLHAFLDRCSAVLRAGGAIGFVSSDRWLGNSSAADLRRHLGQRLTMTHVERLSVETCFYRPKVRRAGSLPRVHPIAVVMEPAGGAPITGAPISPDGVELDAWTGPRLDDIAQIRLAPWLGPHGVFTIDACDLAKFEGSTGGTFVPVVNTRDVDPRTDSLFAPTKLAIRTDPSVEPTGPLAEHLRTGVALLPKSKRKGSYWVPPEKLGQTHNEDSLMIPRIAKGIRIIELPAGVAACDHNLTLIRRTEAVSLDAIRVSLRSPRTQEWLNAHAQRVENGYFTLTTNMLRRLPFWGEVTQ